LLVGALVVAALLVVASGVFFVLSFTRKPMAGPATAG
jgi:hypothetical protein